jgi:diguanylate cyclase (GGDEF)-like protein
MRSWEHSLARFLRLLGLENIKTRILIFALLATLIPSLTMAWISDVQNSRLITEKVGEELRVSSAQTARAIDIWIKQRVYDLRVFSSSYEVTENLQKNTGRLTSSQALQRLKAYLESVSEKFADYDELMVTDPQGKVVTTSAPAAGPVMLPESWQKQARSDNPLLGAAYWDEQTKQSAMTIAVPINDANGNLLGLVAARLNFQSVEKMMQRLRNRETGQMYLIDTTGKVITTSQGMSPSLKDARLPATVTRAMNEEGNPLFGFTNLQDEGALGSIAFTTQQPWASVAEITNAEAYAQTIRTRKLTMLITLVLLLVVGAAAYFLGASIVRPLKRLTSGASQVSEGNLNVEVQQVGGGEIGYLTEIFNSMVSKLRRNQEDLSAVNNTLTITNKELQQLSTTDALTGLYNRRYMIDTLAKELTRAERSSAPFSILLLDIDHFKQYNDTYGHMAGDELLIKAGMLFVKSIRNADFAARYGGEEFLIFLPGESTKKAMEVAERIRVEVATATADGKNSIEPVTVSIGVATFPGNGSSVDELIANADAALYEAKERGRNQVVQSEAEPSARPVIKEVTPGVRAGRA